MAFDNNNSGTLGRNERKEKDSHPDHRGQCTIDGVEYWISAWIKEGRNGKFFSLAFTPKEQRQQAAPAQRRNQPPTESPAQTGFDDMDDDIPF